MNMFSSVLPKRVGSSKFNLSHERKMSMQMGNIVPIMVQEVLPGDKFRVNSEIFMRFSPLIAPIMHRVNVWTHYFFVPNRLLWSEWEDFITGGKDGDLEPTAPYLSINSGSAAIYINGSLADYLGVPTTDGLTVTQPIGVSALPFRAYTKIYDDYYRDPNLIDPIDFTLDGGNITDSGEIAKITAIRGRAWEKDYFTSALPWAQRGASAAVPGSPNYSQLGTVYDDSGNLVTSSGTGVFDHSNASGQLQDASSNYRTLHNLDSIDVDINDLRSAVRLQEWLERSARGGPRYIEQILSHFGVRSSDARLQRAEYLGGGKQPVVISEVLQTTGEQTPSTFNPLGTMGGHGVSVGNSNRFARRFEEHGWIIGCMSVLPKTAYQQGLDRSFTRWDKLDYYWPEFAHLGEQEVLNKEVFTDYEGSGTNDLTFGYQSRYADYKYKQSSVHGEFKDDFKFWHMGRIFSSLPSLNQSFVQADPTQRIFAVTDEGVHKLYVQVFNNVSALRKMPYYGTPAL